jgi:arginase family enzyme
VNGVARYWQEQGRPLFVLWLDAHADYNTPQTTETGNMHGMSAAFLCGEGGLDGLLGNHPAPRSVPTSSICSASARSIRWRSNWCSSDASRSPTCASSTNSASAY